MKNGSRWVHIQLLIKKKEDYMQLFENHVIITSGIESCKLCNKIMFKQNILEKENYNFYKSILSRSTFFIADKRCKTCGKFVKGLCILPTDGVIYDKEIYNLLMSGLKEGRSFFEKKVMEVENVLYFFPIKEVKDLNSVEVKSMYVVNKKNVNQRKIRKLLNIIEDNEWIILHCVYKYKRYNRFKDITYRKLFFNVYGITSQCFIGDDAKYFYLKYYERVVCDLNKCFVKSIIDLKILKEGFMTGDFIEKWEKNKEMYENHKKEIVELEELRKKKRLRQLWNLRWF